MVHPEAADKRFRVLLSQANRMLYGHRWHKTGEGLRWVRALEYQQRDVTPMPCSPASRIFDAGTGQTPP
jgi:hypothetical protein